MWALAILVLGTVIEVSLFVTVGGWLGLWPTLAIVVGTAGAGVMLLRWQGTHGLRDAQREMAVLRNPLSPLAHGALRLVAGVLLILPGFMTDILGLMLLIPAVRRFVIRMTAERIVEGVASKAFTAFRAGSHPEAQPHRADSGALDGVIDGEFSEIPAEDRPKAGHSGWTRP